MTCRLHKFFSIILLIFKIFSSNYKKTQHIIIYKLIIKLYCQCNSPKNLLFKKLYTLYKFFNFK